MHLHKYINKCRRAQGPWAGTLAAFLDVVMYLYVYLCIYICIFMYICVFICIFMYICVFICIFMYICLIFYVFVQLSEACLVVGGSMTPVRARAWALAQHWGHTASDNQTSIRELYKTMIYKTKTRDIRQKYDI